eukprot:SAG22_NODE_152_length_17377_cov_191.856928_10_plen_83_part_00
MSGGEAGRAGQKRKRSTIWEGAAEKAGLKHGLDTHVLCGRLASSRVVVVVVVEEEECTSAHLAEVEPEQVVVGQLVDQRLRE